MTSFWSKKFSNSDNMLHRNIMKVQQCCFLYIAKFNIGNCGLKKGEWFKNSFVMSSSSFLLVLYILSTFECQYTHTHIHTHTCTHIYIEKVSMDLQFFLKPFPTVAFRICIVMIHERTQCSNPGLFSIQNSKVLSWSLPFVVTKGSAVISDGLFECNNYGFHFEFWTISSYVCFD